MVDQVEIHRMVQSLDVKERRESAKQISSNIAILPDKKQAWKDLFQLSQDDEVTVRWSAVDVMGLAFSYVPDKEQAWTDLHQLTQDNDHWVRRCATYALSSVFTYVPDKKQAWDDLIRLTYDKVFYIQELAGNGLGDVLPQVPNTKQAWSDLRRLIHDKDDHLKYFAVGAIGDNFHYIHSKTEAWKELIQLNKDSSYYVRDRALFALIKAFPHLPDKKYAWDDLHELTQYNDSIMRRRVAYVIGSIFSEIPDKKQAWNDLQKLTADENDLVRAFANYSLGTASIFKATEAQTENELRKQLEKALEFFKKSLMELPYSNPASFCLPFYRAFYAITFKKQEAKTEAHIYLAEANIAVEGSESKEQLLKIVEKLANTLDRAQKEREVGLDTLKSELYEAEKLLKITQEKAPWATKLIEKVIPKINQKIVEIQKKAKIACQQSKGTPVEEIAYAVNWEIQKWRISDQEQMTQGVDHLIFSLKSKISFIPENKHIHDKIEDIRKETDLAKQYEMLPILIALIPTASIHTGDIITSNVTTSGENSPVVIKGENNPKESPFCEEPFKNSWIDQINSPATIAAFIGFLSAEIGTYIYPITYNHLISVIIAIFVFFIVAIFDKR